MRKSDIVRYLQYLPIEDVWGIGRKNAFKLKQYGVYTALDFRNLNTDWLRKNFSINGVRLQKELGEICYELNSKKIKRIFVQHVHLERRLTIIILLDKLLVILPILVLLS